MWKRFHFEFGLPGPERGRQEPAASEKPERREPAEAMLSTTAAADAYELAWSWETETSKDDA